MNKKKISSTKILQESEQSIKGDFDFAVEIEYEKSQVTEQSAIKNALNEINSRLPKGLSARVSDYLHGYLIPNSVHYPVRIKKSVKLV